MRKHSSIILNGGVYNVMYLGTPKVGCSGICDYYFHCQGCCVLKYIIGGEHKCYTLKVRRL